MNRGRVLIAAPVHSILTDRLEGAGYELVHAEDISPAKTASMLADCTGVVTSTRLQLDAALIDSTPLLRWIGRMGSGMEVIDVPYATSKNIACLASPEGNCNAVAEHALGLLLNITKRIASSAEEVKNGVWLREENRGTELEGKTVGIIGFGNTGRAFAQKLQGMDMRILVYDKHPVLSSPGYVTPCDTLERIWNEAQIVSFHVPAADDTFHYFNAQFLARVMHPHILLNTSRGNVIDASIMPKALINGRILGAGLDVWEEEPLGAMGPGFRMLLNELIAFRQVIVTPHIAGYTVEALFKMSKVLTEKLLALSFL